MALESITQMLELAEIKNKLELYLLEKIIEKLEKPKLED